MPDFSRNVYMDEYETNTYVTVDTDYDFEVSVADFLDECTEEDLDEIVERLNEQGHQVSWRLRRHEQRQQQREEQPAVTELVLSSVSAENLHKFFKLLGAMPDEEFNGIPDEYLDILRARLGTVEAKQDNPILHSILLSLEPGQPLSEPVLNELRLLSQA